MKRIFSLFVALVAACAVMAAENVIVPRPASFESQKGKLSLTSKTIVVAAERFVQIIPMPYNGKDNAYENSR